MKTASMTVIGAGSYGTALAITLARNGHQVVLWGMILSISIHYNKNVAIRHFCLAFLSLIVYLSKRTSNVPWKRVRIS